MTMSLDVTTVSPRSALLWAATIGGTAAVIAIGLLIAQSFSYTPPVQAGINARVVSDYDTAAGPTTTSEIVPSPAVEANPQFFFGCGDGSNGYYAERPGIDRKPDLVRYERMP